jgi:hypothetical protein
MASATTNAHAQAIETAGQSHGRGNAIGRARWSASDATCHDVGEKL